MKRILTLLALAAPLALAAAPTLAQDLPPGLRAAELRPGWVDADGSRVVALHLTLEPGWKTYWKSPGDAGIPPQFDWSGAVTADYLWPRPEVIDSGGERSFGYHDELVLPVRLQMADPHQPVSLTVDFGLCEDVCVPAHSVLQAPAPQTAPDPLIQAALARQPDDSHARMTCRVEPISDGLRVTASLPADLAAQAAAITMDDDSVWVSAADLDQQGDTAIASADLVDASGAPFALDGSKLALTLLAPDGAVQAKGCD